MRIAPVAIDDNGPRSLWRQPKKLFEVLTSATVDEEKVPILTLHILVVVKGRCKMHGPLV